MNKKVLIIATLVVLGIGGSVLAYTGNQTDKKEAARMAMEKESSQDLAMSKDAEAERMAMQKETTGDPAMQKEGDAMQKDEDVMAMSKGSYTDYSTAKLANAENGKVVLFFHAPWCPTCKEANTNFETSQAPDGLTLLKVDYDSSRDLKKKYGVTYQHTFVQVDKDGNLIKKWNGSANYDAIKAQEI